MQDTGPSIHELYLRRVIAELPRPSPVTPLSRAGINRFAEGDLGEFQSHYVEHGVGAIFDGRAALLSPETLDAVWAGLALPEAGESVLALTATSLGAVVGMGLEGRLMLIDPLDGSMHVVGGPAAAEDRTAFQIRMAEEIGALELQLATDAPHIDLEGDPLHDVLLSRLGPLGPGECYGATLPIEDDRFYDSATWTRQSLSDYILARHRDDPFDRTDFDAG